MNLFLITDDVPFLGIVEASEIDKLNFILIFMSLIFIVLKTYFLMLKFKNEDADFLGFIQNLFWNAEYRKYTNLVILLYKKYWLVKLLNHVK